MKRCPTCNRTYSDFSLNFCLEDGTPLLTAGPAAPDPNATIRYPGPRTTSEPPPTAIYQPTTPAAPPKSTAPPPPPQQWSPMPAQQPQKKSNAVWWVLGGLAAVLVIGIGLVVMIIALASLGSNVNNSNLNANTRNDNRNTNVAVNTNANSNTNTNANANLPTSLADDFSEQKWGVGTSQYGRIWYDDGEYHMVSKERTFVVMHAPSDAYNTENAKVSVTARSVDGNVPSAGFGLMVHCSLKGGKIEDYALLIYPSEEPEYRIVMHKNGTESSLVDKTKSDAIKPGNAPNQLEIRVRGNELSFYVNGQFLNRISDRENYRRGRAGLYTSDIHEVAFDDLVIDR